MGNHNLSGQYPWWEIVINALLNPKYYLNITFLIVLVLLAIWNIAYIWKSSQDELSQRDAEQKRRQSIVNSATPDSKKENSDRIDIFTDEIVQLEPSGQLSIVATISSFGILNSKEPTIELQTDNAEVLRPLRKARSDQPIAIEKHEILNINSWSGTKKQASVVLLFRHSELHHGELSVQHLKFISDVESAFSRLHGAEITLSIYVASHGKPQKKNFVSLDDEIAFSVPRLARSPFAAFMEEVRSHKGNPHDADSDLAPHIRYILNETRSLPKDTERVVAVMHAKDRDKGLKRDEQTNQFVQFYMGESTSPHHKLELQKHGLLMFTKAVNDLRKGPSISENVRVWAGQYAAGHQLKYKVYWSMGSFDPDSKTTFYLHLQYPHFEEMIDKTIKVNYTGHP